MENKVYADALQSIQEFNEKIRAVINEIEPQMCENVMENFIKRTWSCKHSRGGDMNDIVLQKTHVFLINQNKTSNWETLHLLQFVNRL